MASYRSCSCWTSATPADDRARPPVQPPGQPMAAEIVDDDARGPGSRSPGFVGTAALGESRRAWQQSSGPRWPKLLVAAVIIFVFLVMCRLEAGRFGSPIRPWMMFLTGLAAYGAYRLVRFVTLPSTPLAPPTPVRMAVPAAVPVPTAKVSRPMASKESALPAFVVKPPAVRAAELIGSLLVSAAVTAAMCVVMRLIEGYRGTLLEIEQCAWLYLVSLAGTWLVLIAAKFWEGSPGERMLRHFILMILGFGLGLAAFGLAETVHASGCPSSASTAQSGPTRPPVPTGVLPGRPADGDGLYGGLRHAPGRSAVVAGRRSAAQHAAGPVVARGGRGLRIFVEWCGSSPSRG